MSKRKLEDVEEELDSTLKQKMVLENERDAWRTLARTWAHPSTCKSPGIGTFDTRSNFRHTFSFQGHLYGHYGMPLSYDIKHWAKIQKLPDDKPEFDTEKHKRARDEWWLELLEAAENGIKFDKDPVVWDEEKDSPYEQ